MGGFRTKEIENSKNKEGEKMSKLPLWLLMGWLADSIREEPPIVVPSCKVKQPRQHTEPSKQKLKRREGKKNRKNRGKNRGK